ncbi:MAG: chromosomal replication initiator protein DnaA [Stellaceae bacterium]
MAETALEKRDETSTKTPQFEWDRVLEQLREEIGDIAYRSWLAPVNVQRIEGGEAVIAAPARLYRDWVASHYADRILALWRAENRQVKRVSVVVAPPICEPPALRSAMDEDAEESAQGMLTAIAGPVAAIEVGGERPRPAGLDPRFTFENFVVGKPNELAHAAARRVAEACSGPVRMVPFNPLYLYGGVGLGKTHLMHAIAWHIHNSGCARKVIYLSAEKFMHQFIRALRFKSIMDFKDEFRSVDLLMIDDVQFISGKESTQEEFFHTFNALVDQNRQIVISADKSPSDLEGLEERMRSRLGWGLVADLHPTTYELRLGILQSKAEQANMQIPRKVLELLAHRITSNVRELEGALNRIVANMQLVGREISLESAQEELHDLFRLRERRVMIDEIQRRVAEHFNVRLAEMTSARRARAFARPRQVAMYLSKQLTSRSLPEIGRKFGGRDHTTVMHAVRRIEELKDTDPVLAEDIELLRRMLQG